VTDNVGSTAVETDYLGNILNESLFFPYGVERVIEQSDTANNYKFTGKERDTETGLDDFGARYYDSNLGRFMTPDWDAKPTSVPYAKFGDPQTLNLYAYVENGPLNNVDADGHATGGPDPIDPAHQPGPLCLTGVCIQLSGLSDATGKTSADVINQDAKDEENQQQASQQDAPEQAQEQKRQAIEATFNFASAGVKIGAAGEAVEAGIAGAEAGPVDWAVAGGAAFYLGLSASGNIAAGGLEAVGSMTGHTKETEEGAELATTVTSGSGAITLLRTGDVHKAAEAAAWEGILTSNPKDLARGGTVSRVVKAHELIENVNTVKSTIKSAARLAGQILLSLPIP
jgi:RHS repeat-associated protein